MKQRLRKPLAWLFIAVVIAGLVYLAYTLIAGVVRREWLLTGTRLIVWTGAFLLAKFIGKRLGRAVLYLRTLQEVAKMFRALPDQTVTVVGLARFGQDVQPSVIGSFRFGDPSPLAYEFEFGIVAVGEENDAQTVRHSDQVEPEVCWKCEAAPSNTAAGLCMDCLEAVRAEART
jgi:hypothetical protein